MYACLGPDSRSASPNRLIVAAILALLVGLVLPAVQRAREAGVRTRCQDNLRRIGEALHAYHDNHGRLPAGINRYHPDLGLNRPPNGYHAWWSWMAELLPESARRHVPGGRQLGPAEPNPHSSVQLVAVGVIDRRHTGEPGVRRSLADGRVSGRSAQAVLPAARARRLPIEVNGPIAFTGYMGNSGTHGGHGGDGQPPATLDGVLYFDSQVRFADLKAGLADVIAVGERPPYLEFQFGWWFAGAGYDADPALARRMYGGTGDVVLGSREHGFAQTIGADCNSDLVGLQSGSVLDPCSQAHFWSFHPGGAYFLFCDGSVRFLTAASNEVLPAMSTRGGAAAPPAQ